MRLGGCGSGPSNSTGPSNVSVCPPAETSNEPETAKYEDEEEAPRVRAISELSIHTAMFGDKTASNVSVYWPAAGNVSTCDPDSCPGSRYAH